MSTRPGLHSRGRLAAALTAVAAAAVPTQAAEATPVAKGRSEGAVRQSAGTTTPAAAPTRKVVRETTFSAQVSNAVPAPAADDTIAYHPDAVADLELVKVSAGPGDSVRLSYAASHDGLLRVKWSGGGQAGSEYHEVRAGHGQVRLRGGRSISHLRLRATLQPNVEGASATASGSFKLRR